MPSKPIPGSTGEVLTCLPSPYLPHPRTGLLYLPRFIAKCKYVKEHGALPASYAKNFKRGLDRFLCMHLGIDPAAVEQLKLEELVSAKRTGGLGMRIMKSFMDEVHYEMHPGVKNELKMVKRLNKTP